MGSVYAGLLAANGHEVWAIDTWREHVDAMQQNGLRVEGASGDRVARLSATSDAADAGACDLIIIATKAMHVTAAARSAQNLLAPNSVVLSIQNGLGGPDMAAAVLGVDRVLVGVVGGFGASMKAPGHVHHHGWELVRLGELVGATTPRLQQVAEVWSSAGFRVKCFDDIAQLIWEKLICNVTFSGICALTERRIADVMQDKNAWRVASTCASEAFAVARALGVHLDFDDPVAYVKNFGEKIPGARPSALLDVLTGRMSENDFINGAIGPAGEKVGVFAPYNEAVSDLVRAKERQLGLRK